MKSRTCFQPSQPPLEAEGAKESPCPGGLCGNPAKQGTGKKSLLWISHMCLLLSGRFLVCGFCVLLFGVVCLLLVGCFLNKPEEFAIF